MDERVTRLLRYVAADELAVHAHAPARDVELLDLRTGDLLKALLHQVCAVLCVVLANAAAEQIPCVERRKLIVKALQAQRLAHEQVELATVEQVLVAAAVALLEHRHGHQHADRGVGTTLLLAIREQDAECPLVYPAGDKVKKLVVPRRRGGVLLDRSLAHHTRWRCEYVKLLVGICLAKHW